jgi:hypothetical protein
MQKWPNLAALAHFRGGWGSSFCKYFLPVNEGENVKSWQFWKFCCGYDMRSTGGFTAEAAVRRSNLCEDFVLLWTKLWLEKNWL